MYDLLYDTHLILFKQSAPAVYIPDQRKRKSCQSLLVRLLVKEYVLYLYICPEISPGSCDSILALILDKLVTVKQVDQPISTAGLLALSK